MFSDLKGMNWVNVKRDLYAAMQLKDLGVANVCPDFITKGTVYIAVNSKFIESADITYIRNKEYQMCDALSSWNSG